jgi:hypothetical protein
VKKLYGIIVMYFDDRRAFAHGVYTLSHSDDEAVGAGHRIAKELFGEKDFKVIAFEIPSDVIELAVKEIKAGAR